MPIKTTVLKQIPLLKKQKDFFYTGATLDVSFRIAQLKRFYKEILARETDILDALKQDLHKHPTEGYITEVASVLHEIRYTIKHLKKWAAREKVCTPLVQQPGRSYIYQDPYGSVLIFGAWNYPIQILLSPLVGAIAAGNCVIIKPSEVAKNSAKILQEIVDVCFAQEHVACVQGGVETNKKLLKEKFDYIFFTGSTSIGKIVMQAAAQNLTPVTLELGGKSPCFVDKNINISIAARRIVWGKFINSGQICLSPDYLLVHEDIKDKFVKSLITEIKRMFTSNPINSSSYGRMINSSHCKRVANLFNKENILFGGEINIAKKYIEPTIIDGVTWKSPIMQEEIFGPVLPIITYSNLDDAISKVQRLDKPLALYVFSHSKPMQEKVLSSLSAGGGCINDTLIHSTIPGLPFGGIGASGLGAYHGKKSFETFSHKKSYFKRSLFYELIVTKLRYPPYKLPIQIFKFILRWF